MRTAWRIGGSTRGSRLGRLALLGVVALGAVGGPGCSSTPLDGYRMGWVGPIFRHGVSARPEALHEEAQAELVASLERNEIFKRVMTVVTERVVEGEMCYITGVLSSPDDSENWTRFDVTIKDASSAGVIAELVFEPEGWEVSGPEARVPFLVQRLVDWIAEHKSDSPSDRKP